MDNNESFVNSDVVLAALGLSLGILSFYRVLSKRSLEMEKSNDDRALSKLISDVSNQKTDFSTAVLEFKNDDRTPL